MWRSLSLLALLTLALAVWGQEGPTFGIIRGSVKLDSGDPRPDTQVTVVVAGNPPTTYSFNTDAKGEFNRIVRTGKATVIAEGVSREVTITESADGVSVALVITLTGIIVEAVYPDGTPAASASLTGRFWMANGTQNSSPRQLTPNKFWFQTLPPQTTEFGVRSEYFYAVALARWKLDDPARRYNFKLTLPKPVKMALTVTGEDGAPVPQTSVRGTLDCAVPGGEDQWTVDSVTSVSRPLQMTTDANGVVTLTLCPGKYALRLRAGKQFGNVMALTVPADKEDYACQYSLAGGKPRAVTQTVFTGERKPAAGVKVYAIYSLDNTATLLEATADAQGKVVWENLPPVKAIVWGPGVPVGIMRGDETAITEPLLPVTVDQRRSHSLQLKFANVPADCTRITFASSSRTTSINSSSSSPRESGYGISATPGMTFSVCAMANGSPPRFASLDNVYCPLLDENEYQTTLTVPMVDGALLTCNFATADGKPQPTINRIGVSVLKTDRPMPALAANAAFKEAGLFTARAVGGGKYRICLPGAGSYRLLPDLFDESSVPMPQLDVTVKDGLNTQAVTLPAPLLAVPGGTQVYWLTNRAPSFPGRLTVAAGADTMPVFGPREDLLCLWYRPAPNRLVVLRPGAAGLEKQELTLRSVVLKGTLGDGNNLNNWYLHPLFPYGRNESSPAAGSRANETETFGAGISAEGQEVNIWTTDYLCSPYGTPPFATLTVPAAGPGEMTVPLASNAGGGRPMPSPNVTVRVILPEYNYAGTRTAMGGNPSNITYSFDAPRISDSDNMIYPGNLSTDRTVEISLPRTATKLSLSWPGFGAIRNVALPDLSAVEGNAPPAITLPAWEDGAVLSGQILRTDGKPWAKKRFMVGLQRNNAYSGLQEIYQQTDADGKFSLKGFVPGVVFVYPRPTDEPYNETGGWAFNVPDAGLKDLTLQLKTNVFRVGVSSLSRGILSAWWIPDRGTPTPLPVMYGGVGTNNALSGPGSLWAISPDGAAVCEAIAVPEGSQTTTSAGYGGRGFTAPLGIHLPLDVNTPLPGRVILTGQGPLAGITAEFPGLRWHPSLLLNRVVTQIDAVPAGKWQVRIVYGDTIIDRVVEVDERGGLLKVDK